MFTRFAAALAALSLSISMAQAASTCPQAESIARERTAIIFAPDVVKTDGQGNIIVDVVNVKAVREPGKSTGVVLSPTMVLATFHGVRRATVVTVTLPDRRTLRMREVDHDWDHDLALLEIAEPGVVFKSNVPLLKVVTVPLLPGDLLTMWSPRQALVRQRPVILRDNLPPDFFAQQFSAMKGDSGSGQYTCSGELATISVRMHPFFALDTPENKEKWERLIRAAGAYQAADPIGEWRFEYMSTQIYSAHPYPYAVRSFLCAKGRNLLENCPYQPPPPAPPAQTVSLPSGISANPILPPGQFRPSR
jgi:hypothetical protein